MIKPIPGKMNILSGKIVHAAYQVHYELGPGLLESVYEMCFYQELKSAGLKAERQVPVPLKYKNMVFEEAFRVDILVEGSIIVELKSVEKLLPIHEAQVLTYLKLMKQRVGLLINFNVPALKAGIKRIVL
jgi:GxxExxY protein